MSVEVDLGLLKCTYLRKVQGTETVCPVVVQSFPSQSRKVEAVRNLDCFPNVLISLIAEYAREFLQIEALWNLAEETLSKRNITLGSTDSVNTTVAVFSFVQDKSFYPEYTFSPEYEHHLFFQRTVEIESVMRSNATHPNGRSQPVVNRLKSSCFPKNSQKAKIENHQMFKYQSVVENPQVLNGVSLGTYNWTLAVSCKENRVAEARLSVLAGSPIPHPAIPVENYAFSYNPVEKPLEADQALLKAADTALSKATPPMLQQMVDEHVAGHVKNLEAIASLPIKVES